MEILNRIGNKIRFRNLVMLKDAIVPFHDELPRQLVLCFAGVGLAAGAEQEDVAGSLGMRPGGRRSGEGGVVEGSLYSVIR